VAAYNCTHHIHLEHECISACWLDDQFLWRVTFRGIQSGRPLVRHARFLVTAVGFADNPRGAEEINGIGTFEGRLFHSSQWDHDFHFKDKSVVVIGNGSSANQLVPWLVEESGARAVVQVTRSAHWIASKENWKIPGWQQWCVDIKPSIPFQQEHNPFCRHFFFPFSFLVNLVAIFRNMRLISCLGCSATSRGRKKAGDAG
jgi:cation diffusion facilitator CzcD-associated flavoprotein CzcO